MTFKNELFDLMQKHLKEGLSTDEILQMISCLFGGGMTIMTKWGMPKSMKIIVLEQMFANLLKTFKEEPDHGNTCTNIH